MEHRLKPLPLGIQTFNQIIPDDCVYVDKTAHLARLLREGAKTWFLSRPRRFGKSLTVSTLESLFTENERHLFKGLAVEKHLDDREFHPRPVIRLDMNAADATRGWEMFERALMAVTAEIADSLGVDARSSPTSGTMLGSLIRAVSEKSGKKVAILIDECDSPLVKSMHKGYFENIRVITREYFANLKTQDAFISFVFMTGVTKFSTMRLSSELNSFTDISIDPLYGDITGFTHDELKANFPGYVKETAAALETDEKTALDKIQGYYNGFCFDGETLVYNPFSTLKFFRSRDKDFDNYWFNSASTEYLAKYMQDRHLTVDEFRGMRISRELALEPGEINTAEPWSFLHQTGYLSLRKGSEANQFTLDYPNLEVLQSMSQLLASRFFKSRIELDDSQYDFINAVDNSDAAAAITELNKLYASDAFDEYNSARGQAIKLQGIDADFGECLCRSSLMSFLRGCCLRARAEVHGRLGRSDVVFEYGGTAWVFELKVFRGGEDADAIADEAFEQALAKGYAARYDNPVIVAIAINDKPNVRQITAFKATMLCHRLKDDKDGGTVAGVELDETEGGDGDGMPTPRP